MKFDLITLCNSSQALFYFTDVTIRIKRQFVSYHDSTVFAAIGGRVMVSLTLIRRGLALSVGDVLCERLLSGGDALVRCAGAGRNAGTVRTIPVAVAIFACSNITYRR
jgi:hypothetical protein